MANPQTENGYTKIANEILEAMAQSPCFGFSNGQVMLAIIRKTYGWNKKEDKISISQIENMTKLSRRTVIYALQELEAKRIILISRSSNQINSIKINKDYSTWVVQNSAPQVIKNRERAKKRSAKLRGSAKLREKVVQNSEKNVKSFAPTKETITKETITKERMRKKDFDLFWRAYPLKKDKKKAREKFLKLNKDLLPVLLEAVEKQKQTRQWREGIIPHPTTWINGERWEDEITNTTLCKPKLITPQLEDLPAI